MIKRVLVIGAGWVGRQVAMQIASHGIPIVLLDQRAETSKEATQWAKEQTDLLIAQGHWPAERAVNLQAHWLVENALENVSSIDLAIECIPEQISLKKRLLKQLSEHFPAPTILASNASYLVPSMFSKSILSPERYLHYHFHVPVFVSTLVDLMPGPETSPETIRIVESFSRQIGQEPIVCKREHPGYVFNWLLQALLRAALELADREVADPEEIDHCWQKLTGMPLGPFGIMDQIGIDVIHQILNNARWASRNDSLEDLIKYLEPMVSSGKLGQKVGEGFFHYDGEKLITKREQ